MSIRKDPSVLDERDYKFAPIDADPDFDPAHNKRVIEGVIEKQAKNKKRRQGIYHMMIHDRSKALAMFLKAREEGRKTTDIKAYFGKKQLDSLSGKGLEHTLQSEYDKE